ncbi:hypothetical protein D3C72_1576850 [compost metagenome]
MKALGQPRGRADAAVELAGAGHGQQRVAARLQLDIQLQAVAGDDPTGWVQHVDVARCTFRIERSLHQKRSEMPPRTKAGHLVAPDKAQLQVSAPAGIVLLLFDLLRERHPAAPEIRGLLAV